MFVLCYMASGRLTDTATNQSPPYHRNKPSCSTTNPTTDFNTPDSSYTLCTKGRRKQQNN